MPYQSERTKLILQLNEYLSNPSDDGFEELAIRIFEFQFSYNPLYRLYCEQLGNTEGNIEKIEDVAFLPVSAFKNNIIKTGHWNEEQIFRSSATSGMTRSAHYVRDIDFYQKNTLRIWKNFYGPPENFCFFALLPGYLERNDASLVSMVQSFIEVSQYKMSGFFLNQYDELYSKLTECRQASIPTVLFGVSFALLDFVSNYKTEFPGLIVMETGGLKGKNRALTREEIHVILKSGFGVNAIHSEYGMTELFSQAYSYGDGRYFISDTLKLYIKQMNDPFENEKLNKTGIVNIIDLANLDTCSFIQTEDVGLKFTEESFLLQGRLDYSDLRGCNLLIEE